MTHPVVAMTRSLWLDPTFGASGDMLLGTLVGLGVELDAITAALDALGVDGWSVEESATTRCGLSATRVAVTTTTHDHEAGHGRRWSTIDTMIADLDLPELVTTGARTTFRRLGEIEAAAHAVELDEVHFHEVGAVDAIVDIVGVWIAIGLLDIDGIIVGPVGLGHGTVKGSHGVLPLPAPATASLLAGAPVRPLDIEMETCTPTGAALLATLGSWGPMPAGVLIASARGAGGRDPVTHPNVVTGHLVETGLSLTDQNAGDSAGEGAVVLETNLDDVTPEVLGYVIERLLDAGADDAWVTPIVMKKGRPAHQLSALTTPDGAKDLRAIISAETGSLGIRQIHADKFPLDRSITTVSLVGHPVRIKSGPHGAKPEHDDLVVVAASTGTPLRELALQALALWRDNSHF